jgi:hypothetical protein
LMPIAILLHSSGTPALGEGTHAGDAPAAQSLTSLPRTFTDNRVMGTSLSGELASASTKSRPEMGFLTGPLGLRRREGLGPGARREGLRDDGLGMAFLPVVGQELVGSSEVQTQHDLSEAFLIALGLRCRSTQPTTVS